MAVINSCEELKPGLGEQKVYLCETLWSVFNVISCFIYVLTEGELWHQLQEVNVINVIWFLWCL